MRLKRTYVWPCAGVAPTVTTRHKRGVNNTLVWEWLISYPSTARWHKSKREGELLDAYPSTRMIRHISGGGSCSSMLAGAKWTAQRNRRGSG